ncbi:hypothetical protein KEM56_004965, partial [Ascosphaera pollenicola]
MSNKFKESFERRFSSDYEKHSKNADTVSVNTETTAVNENDEKKEISNGPSTMARMKTLATSCCMKEVFRKASSKLR